MSRFVSLLLRDIGNYGLADRYDQLAALRYMCMSGRVAEQEAEFRWNQIQPLIEELKRKPNYLARAPTMERGFPRWHGSIDPLGQSGGTARRAIWHEC
jgi:hypothetical protein